MRDILAKLMPERATSEDELEEMRRTAWQTQGVIAVRPYEIRDDWLRQALINLAEARYGRRPSRGRTGQQSGGNSAAARVFTKCQRGDQDSEESGQ